MLARNSMGRDGSNNALDKQPLHFGSVGYWNRSFGICSELRESHRSGRVDTEDRIRLSLAVAWSTSFLQMAEAADSGLIKKTKSSAASMLMKISCCHSAVSGLINLLAFLPSAAPTRKQVVRRLLSCKGQQEILDSPLPTWRTAWDCTIS